MKKLEQYLDQVCRGLGGPRELRQHLRRELRDHLLDAMAQHKAAGLPEAVALDRALAEFGQWEDVHSELAATHGQRVLAVLLDKAMQWQERTMKAKWLWTTWAYLALGLVLVLEVLFLAFANLMIVPRFRVLVRHGFVDPGILEQQDAAWLLHWLERLHELTSNHLALVLVAAVAVIALFEWRVRSENKPFIRVAALGTVAVTLMVIVGLMTNAMLIAFELGAPPVARMTRPWAVEQVAGMSKALGALEQALSKKDWPAVDRQAEAAATSLRLLEQGPAIASLTRRHEAPSIEEIRTQLTQTHDELRGVQQASAAKDATRVEAALVRLHTAWSPIQVAAARPAE